MYMSAATHRQGGRGCRVFFFFSCTLFGLRGKKNIQKNIQKVSRKYSRKISSKIS